LCFAVISFSVTDERHDLHLNHPFDVTAINEQHEMTSPNDFATGRQLFDSRTTGHRPASAVSSCKTVLLPAREHAVNQFLEAKLDQLSGTRTKSRSSIGEAEWLVDRRLALVTKCKGSYGFIENGVRFLSAYETVSVIESHEYEVTLNGLPVSLEEAYSLCLTDERDMGVYRVYISLVKQGMRVWPVDPHLNKTGDVRTGEKCESEATKRDLTVPSNEESCPETKRRRLNSVPKSESSSDSPVVLEVSNLTMSQVRHREYIVPPIHEYLKANARSWAEYKEMNCYQDQDFVGRVVDLSNGLSADVSKKLPSSILSAGSTKCINQFDQIYSLNDLCAKIQAHGPKTYSPAAVINFSASVSLNFVTSDEEEGKVVVVSSGDPLPSPQMIHNLSRTGILIVAVIDESLISLFRFSSVTDWHALPSLWLKHVT
jgi:hypothetical protein